MSPPIGGPKTPEEIEAEERLQRKVTYYVIVG